MLVILNPGEAQVDEGARSYRRSSTSDCPIRSRELSTNLRIIELKKKVRTVAPGEEAENEHEGIKCFDLIRCQKY